MMLTKYRLVLVLVFLLLCDSLGAQEKKAPDNVQLDQRLQRIERILDNQVLLDLLQRIETMQTEVRQLRGEIEGLGHEMKSMSKRQRDLYLDTDRRLQAIESGSGGGLGGFSLEELAAESLADEEGSETTGDDSQQSIDALPAETGVAVRSEPAPGEKDEYTKAYEILMAGNNDEAIKSFGNFLDSFPTGPYSDNAWYWRGEANYVSRQFDDALTSFYKVINEFPDSSKVPDAKLKVAYTLYEQNKFEDARRELQSLVNAFPESSASRLAQKRLQSMSAEGQ